MQLEIATPRWAVPLLQPARYKGAHGGRAGGKSHFFGELMVEEHVINKNQRSVCIREVQKSLKFSAKSLIEDKIKRLGVEEYFEITGTEIRKRKHGDGIIIFQGMQDHTADSIKSLEGFDRAWVEEGQRLSNRSLRLLRPTIVRKEGAEIWFSWNPDQPEDPVDDFFRGSHPPENSVLVKVNYTDNPFITDAILEEAAADYAKDPELAEHVWGGGYNTKSEAQIFSGCWVTREFDIRDFGEPKKGSRFVPAGPYYGLDFGFAKDPTAAVRCWIWDNCLWVDYTIGEVGLDLSDTNEMICEIPEAYKHKIIADSARPETINHLRKPWVDKRGKNRKGLHVVPCEKWSGSIEDGIEFLKSFDKIVIHPRCKGLIYEAYNYKYKVDRLTEEIMPKVEDKDNHYWDALRYALNKLIKSFKGSNLGSWV